MQIRKGDYIRITMQAQPPFTAGYAEGTVISAVNWGTEENPNWYIEIDKSVISGNNWSLGYGYWKQKEDGGFVTSIQRAQR